MKNTEEHAVEEQTVSSENDEAFPRIGGVFLGPVPEIEKEFYEELLEQLDAVAVP